MKIAKIIAVSMVSLFSLTGCNASIGPIMLIEKIPDAEIAARIEKQKQEEKSKLGEVIVIEEDENKKPSEISGTDLPGKEDEPITTHPMDPTEDPVEVVSTDPLPGNENGSGTDENLPTAPPEVESFIYEENGVRFTELEPFTGYVLNKTKAKTGFGANSKSVILEKGEKINIFGISEDLSYYIARYDGVDRLFIKESSITKEFVEPKVIVDESQDQPKENGLPNNSEPQQIPAQQPPVQKPKQGLNPVIAYPNNPGSVTIEDSISFADASFNAKTIADTRISSGPGAISNSTGYYELYVVPKGTVLSCNGVGINGYVRIAMSDGTSGFIDSRYLQVLH